MTNKLAYCFMSLISIGMTANLWAAVVIDHQMQVDLQPQEQTLRVRERIALPPQAPREFVLHAGLEPHIVTPGAKLTQTAEFSMGDTPLQRYRVSLPDEAEEFTLEYGGKIAHEMHTLAESPGRSRKLLSGTISSQGVFLDAGVAWYPQFADSLQTFSLTVKLPPDWRAVSQGAGPEETTQATDRQVTWRAQTPQDDIYLIAAPYHFYSSGKNGTQAQAFLRQDDPALAQRYLDATHLYLELYGSLIGPYPYPKFGLVENFWETGYGMPSFTLLGSRVMRLPFILHTSYPHEILHNWWGNGVFVDYASGNWSEGLTAYLADHLLKEQQGQGIVYRRSALQRFGDFVRSENDFPLEAFRSRHTTASQSVGYDKSLMLFHMLRRQLGDEDFRAGLRRFYQDNLFKQAGFSDLQRAFESVSKTDLSGFFQQWTQRTGAPRLAVEALRTTPSKEGYRIDGLLVQSQAAASFDLDVPLLVYLEDGHRPVTARLSMRSKRQPFSLDLPARPIRLDIDPWFDLFRDLQPTEAPPTLGKLFGAEQVIFVLPEQAPEGLLAGYRQLAEAWSQGYADASILGDGDLDHLPQQASIWLLGWENRHLNTAIDRLDSSRFKQRRQAFALAGKAYDKRDSSLVMVNHQGAGGQTLALLATDNPRALPGLARKVPHYGKYSYLVFSGDAPENRGKGQWPVSESPLKVYLTADRQAIAPLKPTPLWPLSQ